MHDVNINYIINQEWGGYSDKIFFMKKAIENINDDDDIICFIDAYDVLVNSCESDIIDKFLSYNCEILLGAELNCYPPRYKTQMDDIISNISPETLNRYVNSGVYIGYKIALSKLFNWKNDKDVVKICENGGDQNYFMEYYIGNYSKENMSIDSKSLIFQNMHLISWNEVYFKNGDLFNSIMQTKPCFIHFNGSVWQTQEGENIMPVFVEKK